MDLANVWRLLHLFFSFAFVSTLVVAQWNGRAARATRDWGQRAILFQVVHLATRGMGLGTLVLLGVFGHLNAVALGYRMADPWLRWVTGLWLAALATMVFLVLPAGARLAAAASTAAGGGEAAGFDAALKRWRLGHAAMSVFYVVLLVLMVFRWRS